MQDFCQADSENTALDVSVRGGGLLGTCFSSLSGGESSLAVGASPWAITDTSEVFWLTCFVQGLKAGCLVQGQG